LDINLENKMKYKLIIITFILAVSSIGQVARPTINPFAMNGGRPTLGGFGGVQSYQMPFSFGNGRPTLGGFGGVQAMPFHFGNNQSPPTQPSGRPTNNNGGNSTSPPPTPQTPNTNPQGPNNNTNTVNSTPRIRINNGYARGVMVPHSVTGGNSTSTNTNQQTSIRLNLRNAQQMFQMSQSYKQWRIAIRRPNNGNN
tara:strand:+ start:2375 stop:2965 length:591 start_codon:yes stop_codon:yes gene_type:complete